MQSARYVHPFLLSHSPRRRWMSKTLLGSANFMYFNSSREYIKGATFLLVQFTVLSKLREKPAGVSRLIDSLKQRNNARKKKKRNVATDTKVEQALCNFGRVSIFFLASTAAGERIILQLRGAALLRQFHLFRTKNRGLGDCQKGETHCIEFSNSASIKSGGTDFSFYF